VLRLPRGLFQVGVLDDLRRDAGSGNDVADGLVGVVPETVRALGPGGEVHDLALFETPLTSGRP
jgi:hypothetical protein